MVFWLTKKSGKTVSSSTGPEEIAAPEASSCSDCSGCTAACPTEKEEEAAFASKKSSGFSLNGYLFLGFLPKSGGERKKQLEQSLFSPQAVVLYESPKRILTTLQEIQSLVGEERKAVLCRELTKIHQEIIRGTLKEIIEILNQRKTIKGEMVLVLEGIVVDEKRILPLIQNCIKQLLFTGHSEKDTVELTSVIFGLKKNRLKFEVKHQIDLLGEGERKRI